MPKRRPARPAHGLIRSPLWAVAGIGEATQTGIQAAVVSADRPHPFARAGTPEAAPGSPPTRFEALVAGFGRLVAHAVRRVAGAAAANDLDDIEQEVMLSLWKQISAEQDIAHPASYLYKAAVREAVRAVGRVRRRAEEPLPEADAAAARLDPEAERRVEEREQRDALRAALAVLPPDRARAVRAHLAGFAVQDVMQMYGWSYQRARNLIARGMADLRTELRTRGLS